VNWQLSVQPALQFGSRSWRGVVDTTLCDKVCQWLATGTDSFTPGNPVSSTNKTDRNDIAELLLKVALNTITLTLLFFQFWWVIRFISHLFDITQITINLLHLANKTQICNPRMWRTELYDKTDDFNFPIVNFPFICTELTVSIGEMKSSLRKFCGHHHELTFMEYPCYKLSWICSTCCKQFSILSSCLNYHRVCK
jgi:hypothetical protein